MNLKYLVLLAPLCIAAAPAPSQPLPVLSDEQSSMVQNCAVTYRVMGDKMVEGGDGGEGPAATYLRDQYARMNGLGKTAADHALALATDEAIFSEANGSMNSLSAAFDRCQELFGLDAPYLRPTKQYDRAQQERLENIHEDIAAICIGKMMAYGGWTPGKLSPAIRDLAERQKIVDPHHSVNFSIYRGARLYVMGGEVSVYHKVKAHDEFDIITKCQDSYGVGWPAAAFDRDAAADAAPIRASGAQLEFNSWTAVGIRLLKYWKLALMQSNERSKVYTSAIRANNYEETDETNSLKYDMCDAAERNAQFAHEVKIAVLGARAANEKLGYSNEADDPTLAAINENERSLRNVESTCPRITAIINGA